MNLQIDTLSCVSAAGLARLSAARRDCVLALRQLNRVRCDRALRASPAYDSCLSEARASLHSANGRWIATFERETGRVLRTGAD